MVRYQEVVWVPFRYEEGNIPAWVETRLDRRENREFYDVLWWDNGLTPASRHTLGLCTVYDTIEHLSVLFRLFYERHKDLFETRMMMPLL